MAYSGCSASTACSSLTSILLIVAVLPTTTAVTTEASRANGRQTRVQLQETPPPPSRAPPLDSQTTPPTSQAPPQESQTPPLDSQTTPPTSQTPPQESHSPPPPRPHVVFVMADDMGYGDVGYHNPRAVHSPALDRLSAAGVRLENYYVQPVCSPTRSQFMTGRMQIHTGRQHKNLTPRQPIAMPRDSPTLAEKLRAAGYATHAVGKWHLGYYTANALPTRRGFQTFYGTYTGSVRSHYTFRKCRGRNRCGLDLHDDSGDNFRAASIRPGPQSYSTHLFTRRAEQVIQGHDPETPLFLYLAYTAIHKPFQVPMRYTRQNRRVRDRIRRIHVAMVTALDTGVRRVVRALQQKGLWNNTVFIFSSDNGGLPYSRDTSRPLRGHKGSLLEGGIRAVAFLTSPLLNTTGYSSRALVHVSDWYPTLVRLAGGDLTGTRDVLGYDQWSTLSGGRQAGPRDVLLHNIDPLTRLRGAPLFNDTFDTRVKAALRVGDYKILTGLSRDQHIALYNVRHDPGESTDLSGQRPDLVQTMLHTLQTFQDTAVPPYYPRPARVNPIRHGVWGPWT